MFSIQQLIKALRKLQSGNNTAAVDFAKFLILQNVSSSPKTTTTVTASSTKSIQEAVVTSLHMQQESTMGAIRTSKQQNQKEYENKNNNEYETTSTDSSQNISHITCSETLSQISNPNDNGGTHLNSNRALLSESSAEFSQQIEQKETQDLAICRSQQIQNFYQQQLLYFHTQQNSNLQAKQQQTQFSMSSLAAAVEPMALKNIKQQTDHDEAAGATNSSSDSTANSTGSSCQDDKGTQGAKPTDKPCFNTGIAEILKFMELIGNLKHTKRTGWVLRDVSDCESISGHMYRMGMMTFLLDGSEGLNQIRCMELALVHDLAESLVGDITPFCGISKTDKRTMEFKAMDDICKLIEPRGKRIMELFEEYEEGESAESKFVKDLDRLDMVMQAFEYEKRDNCLLKHQEFFDSTEGKFNHPFVKKLVDEICTQRRNLAKLKGANPPSVTEGDDITTASQNGHCVAHEKKQTNSNSS